MRGRRGKRRAGREKAKRKRRKRAMAARMRPRNARRIERRNKGTQKKLVPRGASGTWPGERVGSKKRPIPARQHAFAESEMIRAILGRREGF